MKNNKKIGNWISEKETWGILSFENNTNVKESEDLEQWTSIKDIFEDKIVEIYKSEITIDVSSLLNKTKLEKIYKRCIEIEELEEEIRCETLEEFETITENIRIINTDNSEEVIISFEIWAAQEEKNSENLFIKNKEDLERLQEVVEEHLIQYMQLLRNRIVKSEEDRLEAIKENIDESIEELLS